MDGITTLLLLAAVWRISYALTAEDGPKKVFVKLRALQMGGLFDCIYCVSIYVGFFAVLLWLWGIEAILYPFGLSGLAMMLRSYTGAGLHD